MRIHCITRTVVFSVYWTFCIDTARYRRENTVNVPKKWKEVKFIYIIVRPVKLSDFKRKPRKHRWSLTFPVWTKNEKLKSPTNCKRKYIGINNLGAKPYQYTFSIQGLSIALLLHHSQLSSGTITASYPFQKTQTLAKQIYFTLC
jgi:hypothetical protein